MKQNENNKKRSIIFICAIVLVFVLAYTINYLIMKDTLYHREKTHTKKSEVTEEKEKTIYFYETEGHVHFTTNKYLIEDPDMIVSEYDCETEECNTSYATKYFSYPPLLGDDTTLMIHEDNYYVHYDAYQGEISRYKDNARWLHLKHKEESTHNGELIVIQKYYGTDYVIIDKEGSVIKYLGYDRPLFFANNAPNRSYYSIEDNMIVICKENKCGLTHIDSEDNYIDFEYDNIHIINKKYATVRLRGKWYLYNIEKKEDQIEKGYDDIIPVIDEKIILVDISDNLYFKDYNGNNIIEDSIENVTSTTYNVKNPGIEIKANDGIVEIIIHDQDLNGKEINKRKYEYDINSKKLTKVE